MDKKDLSLLTDDEITEVFQESVRKAIERSKAAGKPICCYDSERKASYILYPDGRREYAKGKKHGDNE